jgi:multiple sugar transport system ATP-binding protein
MILEKISETAKLLGIEDLLDRKPSELSGGQRQRVAMGRALVRRPKLFLLDEPLSNLDARLRANVRLELKQLHQQLQGTFIYVTHDQIEAMTLGDRVVVMKEGEIRQVAPPRVIYSAPSDTFVARFIGSPEMNLFKGEIIHKESRVSFKGNGFELALNGFGNETEPGEAELGLRPEDIVIIGDPVQIPVKVEMTTHMGSENFIHGRIGNESITIRASKDEHPKPGSGIFLKINPGRVHLFRNGFRLNS